MLRLCLLKVGSTLASLRARRGDYDAWFLAGLGLEPIGGSLEVVHVADGEPLPRLGALCQTHHRPRGRRSPGSTHPSPLRNASAFLGPRTVDPRPRRSPIPTEPFDTSHLEHSRAFDGIVVTGSAAMVTDRAPWSLATAAFLRDALDLGIPVLGVCYGHQLLAAALGAPVGPNPRGRQIGTIAVNLTAAGERDLLFARSPARLTVQASHSQSVLALPPELELLATSAGDPHHAFRVRGKAAWGVQFHPEFDAEIAREYIVERRDAIAAEGQDPGALLAAVVDSGDGTAVLRRFAELCAEGAEPSPAG